MYDCVDDIGHCDVDAFLGKGGHGFISNTARNDMREHGHIGLDIDCEAMHRTTASKANTDCGDLARVV